MGDQLKRVEEERIFKIEKLSSGNFLLTEKCDEFFTIEMTPAELMQLTVELRQLLND